MSKKLSKISKELKIGYQKIVDFLNDNGREYQANPSENISEDDINFLRNNIRAWLESRKKVVTSLSNNQEEILEIPVELKVIDAASKQRKLIERIIGFTDFKWRYSIATYHGECSQPVKFNEFDRAICSLLVKEEMSLEKVGAILGFDIINDNAEAAILRNAIEDLINDNMLEGDESRYWLSDIGKKYAEDGEKYSTFQREFNVYIDNFANFTGDAKVIFENLKSEPLSSYSTQNFPQKSLSELQKIAEVQAPEVHFPKKRFILQNAIPVSAKGYEAKVFVILLENFRDNIIRALIYDENQDKIIEELSEAFDMLEDEKTKIIERLVKESKEDDFDLEFTTEQKSERQIELENKLITKQVELEQAFDSQNSDKIQQVVTEAQQLKSMFNSLEFEVELKHIFDTTKDELWIISPWIKKYALRRRIPFFKNYLEKGGRIFIVYSLSENKDDEMADPEILKELENMEKGYNNFYIHQLAPFHYKRVWIRTKDKNDYYTGSYNVLSFFVEQGSKSVRQEEMTRLVWNSEHDKEYKSFLTQFANKYIQIVNDEIGQLYNQYKSGDFKVFDQIRKYHFGKLDFFIKKDIPGFDDKYSNLEKKREVIIEEENERKNYSIKQNSNNSNNLNPKKRKPRHKNNK